MGAFTCCVLGRDICKAKGLKPLAPVTVERSGSQDVLSRSEISQSASKRLEAMSLVVSTCWLSSGIPLPVILVEGMQKHQGSDELDPAGSTPAS